MFFGRTDLRTSVSRAKFDAESDFEVRLAVAPPNSAENDEKLISKDKTFSEKIFGASKNRNFKIFSVSEFSFLPFLKDFGGTTAKRTSKSDSASNFAPDAAFLRSVHR